MGDEKPLREMSVDEIAALKAGQFQKLAHDHNDYTELREHAYQRLLNQHDLDWAKNPLPDPEAEVTAVLNKMVLRKPEPAAKSLFDRVVDKFAGRPRDLKSKNRSREDEWNDNEPF